MSKELKSHLANTLLAAGDRYLQEGIDKNSTVAKAQIEAFKLSLNSLPEGKLKEFISKLAPVQEFASKLNEGMTTVQDTGLKVLKRILVFEAPLAGLIPDKPFSKIAIKTANLGGKVGETIVKKGVEAASKIKSRIPKKRSN